MPIRGVGRKIGTEFVKSFHNIAILERGSGELRVRRFGHASLLPGGLEFSILGRIIFRQENIR